MEDRQGRVTAQYGRVRRLIRELREFDRQYVSYRQVGVRYCAGKRPGVEQTPAEPPVGFAALHAVSSEYPVLIGCFAREDGHKALLLADLSLPWEKRRNEVSLRLSGVERVRVHPSGEARALGGGDGRLVLPLVESGGYFLELETTRA